MYQVVVLWIDFLMSANHNHVMRSSFVDYVMADVLGHFPEMTVRAMFGGYGIYQAGLMFALIAEDQLYFKVDDSNRAQYQEQGSQPFTYENGKKQVKMNYWLVPEDLFDQPQILANWVAQSVQIARSAKHPKKSKRPTR